MKKVLTDNIIANVRKMRLEKDTLDHIFNAYTEGFQAILRGIGCDPAEITILSGCDITVDGQDYTLTAGWAAYANEVFQVDAAVFTAPAGQVGVWVIEETYLDSDPVTFDDGNEFNVNVIHKLKLQSGVSGSGLKDTGEEIALVEKLDELLQIQQKIDDLVAAAPGVLDTLNELAGALNDDPDFAATMTNSLAAKANKTQSAWIDIPLSNGWENYTAAGMKAQYMLDEFGWVHLRGAIRGINATDETIVPYGVLPSSIKPPNAGNVDNTVFLCPNTSGTKDTLRILVTSSNSLGLTIHTYSGEHADAITIYLNGISWDTRPYA